MVIIETCPVCGGDLLNVMLACYPPIPRKECHRCGWSWEGKQEEIVRVPFKEDTSDLALKGNHTPVIDGLQSQHTEIPYAPLKGYGGTVLENIDFGETNVTTKLIDDYKNNPCKNCPNHPDNGGSGICNCILGLPKVTC